MQIKERKMGDVAVCDVEGEINIDTSPDVRKTFDKLIGGQCRKVVLNFGNLNYIDSSGLATLIEMLQRLKKIEGKLRICCISDKIKSIFEITKLEKLFEMFNNEDDALKNF
jgi:anti-sigma B factor antagonist